MVYVFQKLIGRVAADQEALKGRSNEVIRTSQSIKLIGYISDSDMGCLKGYVIDGNKYGAFDVCFG